MKVRAFTRYGRSAASTRQRLLQYMPAMEDAGIEIEYFPLLDDQYVSRLQTGGSYSKWRIANRYLSRLNHLTRATDFDVLWVYAELFPYLPKYFERLAFRTGKPVVYDFDDAFFHQYDDSSNVVVRRMLGGKLAAIMAGASACSCGNAYLRDYALQYCPNSIVIPTVVDTELYRPRDSAASEPLVIGWIGSPSTWCNVQPLLPVLREIAREHRIRVRVIGAGNAAQGDVFDGLELVEWSEATEVEEVRSMDVGIMPLLDLPFQRGKSGYKLIQYMACGLPVIASPVGVNSEIVEPGLNGLLATTPDDWRSALHRLLGDPVLRARMGAAGRERAVARYSLASQAPRLIQLFRQVGASSQR